MSETKIKATPKGRESTRLALAAQEALSVHPGGDGPARAALEALERHVREIVRHAAIRAYRESPSCDIDDLRQFAMTRMTGYVARFNPGTSEFNTYLGDSAYLECRREWRRLHGLIRLPEHVAEAMSREGRPGAPKVSTASVEAARKIVRADPGALDYQPAREESEPPASDDDMAKLRAMVASLPDRERVVLTALHGVGGGDARLLREIGAEIGVGSERARQIGVRARARLRAMAADLGLVEIGGAA